jgi:hypothetical protein
MPSRWTFSIEPISNLLDRWLNGLQVVVDPFAGKSTRGTHRNDLSDGEDAEVFCRRLLAEGVVADAVLFDPPYSPRQISECYKGLGLRVGTEETKNARLYKRARAPLAGLLRPGGLALSFGWQSSGFSREWVTEELLLVQHGGGHNDTICVVQRKPNSLFVEEANP